MEGSNLNLSALKGKIFEKLSGSNEPSSTGKQKSGPAKDKKEKGKKENVKEKNRKEKDKKEKDKKEKDKKEKDKKEKDKKEKDKKEKDKKEKDKKEKDKKEKDQKEKDNKNKDNKNKDNKNKDNKEKDKQKSSGKHIRDQPPASGETSGSNQTTDLLKLEAISLGATPEDVKLVQGLEGSDDEAFGSVEKDTALASDVSRFVSSLGLSGDLHIVSDEEDAGEEETQHSQELQGVSEGENQKDAAAAAKSDRKQAKKEEARALKQQKKEERKAHKQAKASKGAHNEEPEAGASDVDQSGPSEEPQTALAQRKKSADKRTADQADNLQSVTSDKLRLDTRVDWYNCEVPRVSHAEKCDRFAVERLMDRAKALIDSENRVYLEEFTSNNSQKKFLTQILSSGTLNDKISALTLLVQEAPVHNLKAFDTLMGYCEKKSRTAALQAINAMKDLLLNGLLPDRKLLAFNKQALSKDASDETLALYYFEDHLKKSYFKFIQILEHLTHDPIVHVKMNVVTHIFDLLKAKPEQEANLLRLGVNKLGDIDNKVSSKTSYLILQLEEAHPAMKKIVTDAITDLIFQKKNEHHAQYYTVLTLNQTVFQAKDVELANALVKTYFSLFEKILIESDGASGELDKLGGDKVLGKSETGRKNNKKAFKKGKKGGRSVKAEEKTESEVSAERNSKMFSALLTGLNRALPFANLSSETYLVHLDTLYKITHSTNFNTSVQALILVHQIVTQQDLDSDRYYRTLYESLMDPRLVSSSKQGIYLNLLFKSLKGDAQNIPRILAFVKRMLQICSHWINIGSITGMFYLLMELSKTYPQILELMEPVEARPEIAEARPEIAEAEDTAEEYDPKKRDPRFAHAQKACFWEMTQFVHHYHPTVAIYATSLLEGTEQSKPDLGMYTLAHFLDKFVYRNAKQKPVTRGSSIMQPLGGAHLNSLLVRASNVQSEDIPANTVDWLSRRAETIRPDEKFFYEYFTRNQAKIRAQKPEAAPGEDEGLEESEDAAETEIWNALVKSKPELEASDDDDGFSDFGDDGFSDDDEDLGDLRDGDLEGLGDEELGEFGEEELGELGEEELGDLAVADLVQGSDEDDVSEHEGSASESDGSQSDGFGSDGQGEASSGDKAMADRKRRRGGEENSKSKKTKLSKLPMFASADDYAQYLQSDDDE